MSDLDLINCILRGFSTSLKKMGHEIFELNLKNGFTQNILDDLYSIKPDFVFSYDFEIFDPNHILRKMGLKVIMFFGDNILMTLYGEKKKELLNYPENYYILSFDKFYVNKLKEYGVKNAYYLPHAVDTRKFYPMETSYKGDLCFFGGIHTEGSKIKAGSELVDAFIDKVVALKLKNIDASIMELCDYVFKLKNYKGFGQLYSLEPETFFTQIYIYFHLKGTAVYREFILNNINNSKVNLYGTDINNSGNFIINKPIPYGKVCSEYQSYKINLNISDLQLEHSANNRIFDNFACKSFLLSDYKKDIEEMFPQFGEYITYKSIAELNDKIEYYLVHDKERKEITEELYHIIIKNHTYDNRAAQMINMIL